MKFLKIGLAISTIALVVVFSLIVGYAWGVSNPTLLFKPKDSSGYDDVIKTLKAENYTFVLPRDLSKVNLSKIVVIVHDVDYRPDGAKLFIEVEEKYGVKSAFFLRPDADSDPRMGVTYSYFSSWIPFFQTLEAKGWEIGFHYDCLSRSDGNISEAMILFKAELSEMRAFFNVASTRAHGDVMYNSDIDNLNLYTNSGKLWAQLNLTDFTSLNDFTVYGDTNSHWNIPNTFTAPKILLLAHTDWWGQ